MAFKSHFTARTGTKVVGGGKSNSTGTYGRVIKTILSLTDPDCKDSSMLNGVFYRIMKNESDESIDTAIAESVKFAKQGSSTFRVVPMEGEVVEVVSSPAPNNPTTRIDYWVRIVNIWNHPHHNATPDTKQQNWQDRLIGGHKEQSTINPLQINPGDTLLEGRLGQSIRFGGNKGGNLDLIDTSNDGKPIILISNGQIETKEGDSAIYEDINRDVNSIHLLSDHKTPLKSANKKRDSYDILPLTSDQYIGNQVIVNGGRLYFNAKEDSAFISAKESIGLNAKTINIDADSYFCIDAKKIYLGKAARISTTKEPVVLGVQLENWLTILLDTLDSVAIAMSTATTPLGGPVTQLIATGPELKAVVGLLKSQVITFQSKKVFTE
jgi:hypothetical protein